VWLGWVDLDLWFSVAGCAALGKYFDPEGDRDRRGTQIRHMADDKISKDRPRGLAVQGSLVTWRLVDQFKAS